MASVVTGGAESSPYVGDRPFTREDAGSFFGRTAECEELVSRWRGHRLTVLSGTSGAGLTSLVRAGVVPRVAGPAIEVLPVGRITAGSTFPIAALPEHNPHTLALLGAWSPSEPQTKLAGLTLVDFLRKRWRYTRHTDAYGRVVGMFSAIDQVEELVTGQVDGGRFSERFIEELAEALREIPELHVLLCVRRDYKGELIARLAAGGCTVDAQFELRSLSPATALDAVRLPLAGTGRSFAPGIAE